MNQGNHHRGGFLLIVVLAFMVLSAVLAIAFVTRARSASANVAVSLQQAQARVMLSAACSYICEASRVGWDLSAYSNPTWSQRYPSVNDPNDPNNLIHERSYGWVDVRDGQLGPKTKDYDGDGAFDLRYSNALSIDSSNDGSADRPAWPAVGSVCIAPMERLQRPPYAISQDVAPNAISTDPSDPLFGVPVLRKPDPVPLGFDASDTVAQRWDQHRQGDVSIDPASSGLAWFRIFRDGPATFTITVGAGGSRGYRDWDEVCGLNAENEFGGDQGLFDLQVAQEVRLWYRVEWSPAVGGVDVRYLMKAYDSTAESEKPKHYTFPTRKRHGPINEYPNIAPVPASRARVPTAAPWVTTVNQGGTIAWVQRLHTPPMEGQW
ncbi:MAG: hypothetical protein PF961_03140 [Planctomycetota bacterium]|jgi:hypothetical protein|nr:hypothetical protein [Planctomycetota bacterium]